VTAPIAPDGIARLLVEARSIGRPVAAPMVAPDADAYAVQDAVARALGWFERGGAGHWKTGAASLQSTFTHARLPPAGVCASPADLRTMHFNFRGIEAEIALRLGSQVDAARAAGLDGAGALALLDAMCVSIEVVDSRWAEGLQAPAACKLADLQSHGALVLGDWVPVRPVDWAAQRCEVRIGGAAAQIFQGTHSLGHPGAVLLPWLRHATRRGEVLPAGSVVTTGTWCGLLMAAAGDEVMVDFEGIGSARCRF
jgi:2-keto-4-pentenoate hydratase